MFYKATSFDSDLSNWNVSNITGTLIIYLSEICELLFVFFDSCNNY